LKASIAAFSVWEDGLLVEFLLVSWLIELMGLLGDKIVRTLGRPGGLLMLVCGVVMGWAYAVSKDWDFVP
jgi:hypothetical protein